jgi:hypothetical protein
MSAMNENGDSGSSARPLVRSVRERTLTSRSNPRVEISFDNAYDYVGGQRWELYGLADAEQHLFIDPGSDGTAARLYWVQFEQYLPSNRHTYDYARTRTVDVGGLDFVYDTRAYADFSALNRDPDSDGAHAQALVESRGVGFPKAAVRARMIHLPDTDRRSEFMIIYAESVDPVKLPAGADEGAALDEHAPALARDVMGAALSGMEIR